MLVKQNLMSGGLPISCGSPAPGTGNGRSISKPGSSIFSKTWRISSAGPSFLRASGQGFWLSDEMTEEDSIAVLEVIMGHFDRTFWRHVALVQMR